MAGVSILDWERSGELLCARVRFALAEEYCARYRIPVPAPRFGTFCGWHQELGSHAVLVWFDGDAEPSWVGGESVEVMK